MKLMQQEMREKIYECSIFCLYLLYKSHLHEMEMNAIIIYCLFLFLLLFIFFHISNDFRFYTIIIKKENQSA